MIDFKWEKEVARQEEFAKEILREGGYPETYDELIDLHIETRKYGSAADILRNAYLIREHANQNRINEALDSLYMLCANVEDLLLQTIPGFENSVVVDVKSFQNRLAHGLRLKPQGKSRGYTVEEAKAALDRAYKLTKTKNIRWDKTRGRQMAAEDLSGLKGRNITARSISEATDYDPS